MRTRFSRSLNPGWLCLAALLPWLAGCSTTSWPAPDRSFVFERDTLAFTNQLAWTYGPDADGRWRGRPREPQPDYTLRCFPMARAVKQFHQHARFEPGQTTPDEATSRSLIRQVLSRSPRTVSLATRRVVIPGYNGLREFSAAHEASFRDLCGGAVDSFLQRGHWRIVFPFTRQQQTKMALRVAEGLRGGQLVSLHLLRILERGAFSHAVVAYAVREEEGGVAIEFSLYDPNNPDKPVSLRFDNARGIFELPSTGYFEGGRVDVYEVYHRWYY